MNAYETDAAVLTCAHMSRADAWTIGNGYASGYELMKTAGATIVDVVLRRFADRATVHVLCGPGNNGGDGYVVARLLHEGGLSVRLHAFGDPRPGGDAALAKCDCPVECMSISAFEPDPGDLVVDAVFGAGLARELPEEVTAALAKVNGTGCTVVAVDLPSGVNGDSGRDLGGALPADITVTFFRKKPGHLLYPGRALCGEIIVTEIGVRPGVLEDDPSGLFENEPAVWRHALPVPGPLQYKYSRGHVAVFSGPRHTSGASRLSALAAQRSGAGAVTILGSPGAVDMHAAHVTSIMLKSYGRGEEIEALEALNKCSACVIGPGFGDLDRARDTVTAILSGKDGAAIPLVLDADGLTAFSSRAEDLSRAQIAAVEPGLVLTPHEGEFSRLFPDIVEDERKSKLYRALEAAAEAHAVVVYKGPDTVIASPEGRAAINTNATAALATAGSGDVLAGIIGGLLSQGMPAWEAACAAVWVHGEAGRAAGPFAIAEDLVDSIGPAFDRVLRNQLHE
jgi:hydroxyethylthiazole kinase-like uncharacterized protein yjeF